MIGGARKSRHGEAPNADLRTQPPRDRSGSKVPSEKRKEQRRKAAKAARKARKARKRK